MLDHDEDFDLMRTFVFAVIGCVVCVLVGAVIAAVVITFLG